ncbi:DegV family protein [Clostridium botulinum]|nr:DegV family protein [Clostridium botulinum]NFL59186.1 DegV family protein [Clostridium botulinum]NFL61928.1 DegV family protein [Clostridium botulinum]NFN45926.1 DegV family protein [Clostridium botulinum]NFO66440.1 DegV family protein [Clostridium botulinum]
MQKIALITDSSCDLSESTLNKFNIKLLPFRIIFNDNEYLDRITISSKELFNLLKTEIPTTSLPDIEYSSNIFENLIAENYTHVIIITVSANTSGCFNSIRLLSEHYPEIKSYIFDSKTIGYPVGAISTQVGKLINDNFNFEDIISKLEDIRKKTHAFVTFPSLKYLRAGGRIGRVSGAIAETLNLKPIISSDEDGFLYPFAKARGRKQSLGKLKQILMSYLEKGKCRVWILNGDADEEADEFLNSVQTHENITKISLETIGACTGVHTGPGSIGVCIYEEY